MREGCSSPVFFIDEFLFSMARIINQNSQGMGVLSIRYLDLPPFTLKSPFSAPNQACGPEARALRGKSIGGQKIPTGDPSWLPQNGAGRSGAAQFGMRKAEFLSSFLQFWIPQSGFRI
jgi:hypothetical protein